MSLFESATDDCITYLQNDFASNSFPIFEDAKRFGKLCDVTLEVEDRCLKAHRIILAGTVPYFHAMFTHDMVESKQAVISIKEIDPDALELLVNFAYCGKVKICTSNVQSLLVGSSFLQLTKVRDACCDFLIKRLHPNNILGIKSFADVLGCTILVEAANHYIQMHFTEVARSEEFNNLVFADVKEIISRDMLHVNSEEQVFEAAISWVKSDTLRQKYLLQLLTQVRMPFLTQQYLIDKVATEELIRTSPQCKNLLDNAKDYHLMPKRRELLQSVQTRPRCYPDFGCIYVVGGIEKSDGSFSAFEMFDPRAARWQMVKAMTVGRKRFCVAVMHNKLYAIGGVNYIKQLTTAELFDPELQIWFPAASMNCKKSDAGAATLFNKLYVCGGYDFEVLDIVESYDPEKNVWSMVASMSEHRFALGVVAFEDHIYALGGYDKSYSALDSVERYNPLTGQWVCMPPMLTKRGKLGVATLNGHIYACGGDEEYTIHRTAEVYKPSTKQWSYIASMNVKRSGLALVANWGKLYAIGGYDETDTPLSSVEEYNPELDRWDFVASMCAHAGNVAVGVLPYF